MVVHRYLRAVLAFFAWTALLLLLLYGLVCLVYWWIQERFIFVRFRTKRTFVYTFSQRFTEVFLSPENGVELHALHFTTGNALGTVLYFHGNTGSLRRWGTQASTFTRLGYDVLMPDYRGYGKSRGPLSEAALHQDAQTWYAWLRARAPEERIVVYGRSLGTGMACPVAAENRPRALILESPFANLHDVARHQFYLLPYRWLLRYRFRNDKAIRRVHCPVYIFHGKRDPVVPFRSALQLYARIPSEVTRELIAFERGYHSDLARFPRFQRRLKAILAGAVASRA